MGPEKITRLIQAYLEELVEDKTEVGRGGERKSGEIGQMGRSRTL